MAKQNPTRYDTVWFVLKPEGGKYYVLPFDAEKNKLDLSDLPQGRYDEKATLVLEELGNFRKEVFFAGWGERTEGDYCLDDNTGILDYLTGLDNFVDENYDPILVEEEGNTLSLVISEAEDNENELVSEILINDQYKNPHIIDD